MAALVAAVVIVTGIVAWFAPPQTWDFANLPHEPRGALGSAVLCEPFATGIETQNSRPSLAEFGILQTYVLSNGDRFANFVEWSAMIGSL